MRPTILLLSVLLFSLASAPSARASAQEGGLPQGRTWTLGPFSIVEQILSAGEEGYGPEMSLRFQHQGRDLFDPVEGTIFEPRVRGPLADTPRPGCSALWTTTYSGGAHCCFEDIVLITCPDKDLVVRINLADSEAGDLTTKGRLAVLPLTDWGMSYYGPASAPDLFLPFASSPAFNRFLVFDPDGPRPDRPGEFPGFHANERAEAERGGENGLSTTMAMIAAYHAYMINGDREAARQVLLKYLREPWLSAADTVLEDIVKAADGFDPAKVQVFAK